MLIRYDFDKKPDLSRFCKQASHYLKSIDDITYHFVLKNYRLEVNVYIPDNTFMKVNHAATFEFHELNRDSEGEVKEAIPIYPSSDIRFAAMKDMNDMFNPSSTKINIDFNSVPEVIEKISFFVKMLYKINGLTMFV